MRKIQTVMIGIFCTGVLLTGLGTGIAVSEASSFVYMGEREVGPVTMRTDNFDYTYEPKEGKKLRLTSHFGNIRSAELVMDENVPENTVRFQVTYNSSTTRPYLRYEEIEDGEFDWLWVGYEFMSDDFATFMECKDQIVKELKERKISSYQTPSIEDVTILVNPASVDLFELSD